MPNTRPNKNIPTEQENPLFHDTWKLLKNYRDAVWNLELAVQQVRSTFEIEYGSSIEEFLDSIYLAGADIGGSKLEDYAKSIESLRPHIANISTRTYYRKRPEAVQALSSILWGYTSKDCLEMLDKFFPTGK